MMNITAIIVGIVRCRLSSYPSAMKREEGMIIIDKIGISHKDRSRSGLAALAVSMSLYDRKCTNILSRARRSGKPIPAKAFGA